MKAQQKYSSPARLTLGLIVSLVVFTSTLCSQTTVRPRFNANTVNGEVNISQIDRTPEFTIFSIEVNTAKCNTILFSSETYINDCKGGKPLYISSVEDAELNKVITPKTSSRRKYKLYFPPLKSETTSINYRSGKDANYWHFFDIDVSLAIGVDRSVKSKDKGRIGNCRYINKPGYTAKSGWFNVVKVELCDTATILHFKVGIPSSGWISIPSGSAIRDSNGGKDLYVKTAIGTSIGQRLTRENTGKESIEYKLFFPPIDKSVKKIDFREVNKGGSWYIYELDTDV